MEQPPLETKTARPSRRPVRGRPLGTEARPSRRLLLSRPVDAEERRRRLAEIRPRCSDTDQPGACINNGCLYDMNWRVCAPRKSPHFRTHPYRQGEDAGGYVYRWDLQERLPKLSGMYGNPEVAAEKPNAYDNWDQEYEDDEYDYHTY